MRNKVQKGVCKIVINGDELEGNFIHLSKLKTDNEISAIMG